MTKPSIFVLMHELPVESAGGGVLLREILRHLTLQNTVTAFFPVNSFQAERSNELVSVLASEGIRGVGLPLCADWGKLSFTLRRILSTRPGCVCAMLNSKALECVEAFARQSNPESWLLISPFSSVYLPASVTPDKVRLYYTNVDEDIMVPSHGTMRQRIEGWLEKVKVRLYVQRTARLAGKRAAITENNARVLTAKTGVEVGYVPPLMAPRSFVRSSVQTGLALITTNYTYGHNRISMEWFFEEVWPLVCEGVQLEVTGMDTENGCLKKLCNTMPRVTYLGFLAKDDLEKAFQRCSVVINPTISGSGFQIKMLDALSRGIPLVTTSTANPLGDSIFSTNSPIEFARQITLCGQNSANKFSYLDFYAYSITSWHSFLT